MKGARLFVLLTLTMLIWVGCVFADSPKLVKSIPADGTTGVPTDVGKVIFVFDRNMKMNSWSLITSPKGVFPPMIAQDEPWVDTVTFELKVERLKPNTTYAIQLNSEKRNGFQTAEEQIPLPVTTIVFTTSTQEAGGNIKEPSSSGESRVKQPSKPAKTSGESQPAVSATMEIRPGWQFFVTRSRGMKGIASYATGEQGQFQSFQKIEFTEEVLKGQGQVISEARRQIKRAVQKDMDTDSGQMVPTELAPSGTSFKVVHSSGENALFDAATGEEVWDETMMDNFSSPIISKLWPEGPLSQGQTWSFKGFEVTRRIALFEAKGGEINLQVVRISNEPSTGLSTAQIRGRLKTVVDLETIKLNYDAKVEIDLPLALGVPFMIKLSGKLSGKGVDQDEQGRAIQYRVEGEGDALQICKPAESVVAALGGLKSYREIPTDNGGTATLSLEGRGEPAPPETLNPDAGSGGYGKHTGEPEPGRVASGIGKADQSAGSFKNNGGQGALLSLYQEPYQKAFYILIPKGWRTEGGMIPSGAQWNVVDLVENNISFRATSPDGKSFFGWYPRFYFQDPSVHVRSSGGVLQPQMGGVLNGCWLYPFMDIAQYVQTIVFGQFAAREFENPRIIGSPVPARELDAWIPKTASRAQAGYVNFQCSINGTPSYGRIYTIIYEIQGVIWSTVGTFGWVAPMDRWKQDARTMELSIRSFRLNPEWAQRAAAAERYRGQKYGEVIREMQQIDAEINRSHSQARSDMQEEFYKVITEQIETYDPESGRKEWLPTYNHAWTNGRGDYFLRDYDDGSLPVENPSEWRKLTIINRNDPHYRPRKYGE